MWMNNCACVVATMEVATLATAHFSKFIFIRSFNVALYAISGLEFNDATLQKKIELVKWSQFTSKQ